MVKLLLQFKGNPKAKDVNGSPLVLDTLKNAEMLKAFLDAGADPNANDGQGNYALAMAASSGNSAAVELLLAAKADVNIRSIIGGTTPLGSAVRIGNKEIVELLLTHGANPNTRNDNGLTPLDYTKAENSPPTVHELATLLRQHGALDDLPDFTTIRMTRGTLTPYPVFTKDSAGRNHFTLLEALLRFYYITWSPGPGLATPGNMPFPNLSRIRIQRFSPAEPQQRKEIVVSVLNGTNGIDCAKNMPLEFGDLIEIPEREHSLAERPVGLTAQQNAELTQCVPKKVRISVRGETAEISLRSGWSYLGAALESHEARKLLRSSSDLSHVKVTRKDPATGKSQEFIVDCTPPSQPGGPRGMIASRPVPPVAYPHANRPMDDLWLEDGDVIEVPDKQ